MVHPQRQKSINKIEKIMADGIKSGMLSLTGAYHWKKLKNYNTCMVETLCDCGNTKYIMLSNFTKKSCKSCGCSSGKFIAAARSKHRTHKEYNHFAPYFLKQLKKHLNRGNGRVLELSITIQQLDTIFDEQNGLCYFTGEPLTLPDFSLGYRYYVSDFNVSVDRLNCELGYLKDNCVLCTKEINQMKMDLSVSKFKELCLAVTCR